MTWVNADHHDAAVTADHAAVFADPLHARADLHGFPLLVPLLITVRNTSTVQIVWTHLQHYTILRKNADIILAHFSGNRS